MITAKQPSPALNSFLHEQLEQPTILAFVGWEHSESNIWKVTSQGVCYYLKQYRQPRKYQQEQRAFQEWLPLLAAITPRLIASNHDHHALLMTTVVGELMETSSYSRSEELALHQQAGHFLNSLHNLPYDDTDPLPYHQALLQRFESWRPRFSPLVDQRDIKQVAQRINDILPWLATMKRVPTHRDYSPRNWLLDRSQDIQLGVIDFEHSRPDLWLQDFGRLYNDIWQHDQDLEAAFLNGYGQTLQTHEWNILEVLEGMNALTTIAWAREHADQNFERFGRRSLARFLQQV